MQVEHLGCGAGVCGKGHVSPLNYSPPPISYRKILLNTTVLQTPMWKNQRDETVWYVIMRVSPLHRINGVLTNHVEEIG